MKKFTTPLIFFIILIWLIPLEKLHAQDLFECELDFSLETVGHCGDELGEITVNINGGFGKYEVCWVSNANSINNETIVYGSDLWIPNLPTGFYTFKVTDTFSKCSKVMSITVKYNDLRGNITARGNAARCNGLGSVSFDIKGNSPPYHYTLNGPITKTGVIHSNQFKMFHLPAGDYEIILHKGVCERAIYATVGVKEGVPDFELIATKDDCGIDIGAVDVNIKGGTGPYKLSWEGPTVGTEDLVGNASLNILETGAYKFTLEDASGCRSFQYLDVNATSLSLSPEKVSNALNGKRGVVKLAVEGGVPGFSVSWEGPESGERMDITRDEGISLPAGTFDIEVTDASGCRESISITIEEEIDAIGLSNNHGVHNVSPNFGTSLTVDQPLVGQNYPNPFDKQTTIPFTLPKSMEVELLVHDHLGRLVIAKKELLDKGNQQFTINGNELTSGMFFYSIISGDFQVTKRMVVR